MTPLDGGLGALTALAGAAGDVAEALARDPEAQRIAVGGRLRLRHARKTARDRRRWYREVEEACDDLAEAREKGDSAEAHGAVLRLLALGVSEDMIRVSQALTEVLP